MRRRRGLGAPGTGSEPALGASYEDTYGERPVGQAGDEPALVAMPAAEDVRSFAELYRIRASQTSKVSRWLAVSAVVAIAGPLGIVGALGAISAQVTFFGLLAIVFFGPAVEEISKVMGAVVLIERYPWLIPAAWVIPVMTITGVSALPSSRTGSISISTSPIRRQRSSAGAGSLDRWCTAYRLCWSASG